MTPYDKLKSLPDAARFLAPGVTFEQLEAIAYATSDQEAARRLRLAREELFLAIQKDQTQAPAA